MQLHGHRYDRFRMFFRPLIFFQGTDYYPKSFPKLPAAEILLNGSVEKQVLELASMLDVRSLFYEIGEGPPTD